MPKLLGTGSPVSGDAAVLARDIAAQARNESRRPSRPYGAPTAVQRGVYGARLGELVLADGGATVHLPALDSSQLGVEVTVVHMVETSSSDITILPPAGARINASPTYTLFSSARAAHLVYVRSGDWRSV